MTKIRALALLSALAGAAAPLHAQARAGHLLVAAAPDGTALTLDSASIGRIGESAYFVTAVYQYSPELARQYGFDRLLEDEELDCAALRVRNSRKRAFAGDTALRTVDLENTSRADWAPVSDAEGPLVQAICAKLVGSFAAALPVTLDLRDAETMPVLTNRSEVVTALQHNYPALLRDAGVTGSVVIRIRITGEGRVDSSAVRVESATHDAFGAAAAHVAQAMRFRPALLHGQPVPVWATLPVTFGLADSSPGDFERQPDRPVQRGFPRPRTSTGICTQPPPLCSP
ncbi:MAG TPA: TonB family protein [Longimicrobium sp.]